MQVMLAETQQRLLMQGEQQRELHGKSHSPDHGDSVSPQKLEALQEGLRGLHAEVAQLKSMVYEKDAQIHTLHM